MNILILISSLNIGGAEKQAVNDANLLCESNSVFLIVFKDGLLKETLDKRITYNVLPKNSYKSTAKLIADFVHEKDITVIHASLFAPMIIGVMAAKIANTPIYWSFHSHEYDIPIKSKLSFIIFSRSKDLKKISYVNKELKEFFESKLFLPKKKGLILYNNSEFSIKENSSSINQSVVNIGYVGRVIELKRVEYFIDIAEYLIGKNIKSFAIHIVGDGETRNSIENEVIKKGLKDYFVFHGFRTNLEEYYEMFDLFINPSREECLSIALIDAGMKGIPSIAFDVGGNDEIILDNKSGFIVRTKEELNAKVYELLTNKEIQLRMSNNAFIHCQKNFSKEKRLEELKKLFTTA